MKFFANIINKFIKSVKFVKFLKRIELIDNSVKSEKYVFEFSERKSLKTHNSKLRNRVSIKVFKVGSTRNTFHF